MNKACLTPLDTVKGLSRTVDNYSGHKGTETKLQRHCCYLRLGFPCLNLQLTNKQVNRETVFLVTAHQNLVGNAHARYW